MTNRVVLGAALLSAVLANVVPAAAQNGVDTQGVDGSPERNQGGAEAPMREQPEEDRTRGRRVGDFYLDAGAAFGLVYDDNVFQTKSNEDEDWVGVFSPSVSLTSDWDDHALSFRAGADIGRYEENTSEDYEDLSARLSGRLDVTDTTNVFASAGVARDHETRGSANVPGGAAEPTTYYEYTGVLGAAQRFGSFSLRGGVTAQRLDFQDVDRVGGGQFNSDDRDRDQYEIGGRAGYRLDKTWFPFVQGAYDIREYADDQDDLGFERSSKGYNTALGTEIRLAPGVRSEIFLGYMSQDYDDPRFNTVEGWDAGARLNAQLTERTDVSAYLDRSIEETTLSGSPASIDTVVGGTVGHDLTQRLTASLPLYHVRSDYQDVGRVDDTTGAGFGLAYDITPNLYLEGSYTFERRESTVATADYDNNIFLLRIGAQLAEAEQETLRDYSGQGLYGGLQAGHHVLGTEVDGPRGSGGAVGNEQAGHGAVGGGFVGYGMMLDRWMVGAELELDESTSEWYHSESPQGRDFGVEQGTTYGGGFRLGYLLNPGALVYGRAGVVNTEFEATYNDTQNRAFTTDKDKFGIRAGGGVELTLPDSWFWRLDYTYTAYDDFGVDNNRGDIDRFDPDGSMIRIGLGYRFFDPSAEMDDGAAVEHDFAGPYLGGQAGWSQLRSDNRGTGRGQTGSNTLNVERGGDGLNGGAFGGYGAVFGPIYAGFEVDAEVSEADWDIARTPQRREYSVSKEYAYGGSLRLGYVFEDIAMVYGKVGAMFARFDADYKFSGVGVDTDKQTTEPGIRVGGGVEIPAGENIFVRADYSYTDYDSFSIRTSQGVDSFDSDESVFQIGIGYRF